MSIIAFFYNFAVLRGSFNPLTQDYAALPYIKRLAEPLKLLPKPQKLKIMFLRSNIVYKYACRCCGASYIGNTHYLAIPLGYLAISPLKEKGQYIFLSDY